MTSLDMTVALSYNKNKQVFNLFVENVYFFCVGISQIESREWVSFPIYRQIEHRFVVIFITYYIDTSDIDLMNFFEVYTWNYFVQESSASYVISHSSPHIQLSY